MFSDFFDIYFFDEMALATLETDGAGQSVTAQPFLLTGDMSGEYENIEVVAQPFALNADASECTAHIDLSASAFTAGAILASITQGGATTVVAQPFILSLSPGDAAIDVAVRMSLATSGMLSGNAGYAVGAGFDLSGSPAAVGSATAICPAYAMTSQMFGTYGLSLAGAFNLTGQPHALRDATAKPFLVGASFSAGLSKTIICTPLSLSAAGHVLRDAHADPFTGALSLVAAPSVSLSGTFSSIFDVDAYRGGQVQAWIDAVNALCTGGWIDVQTSLLPSNSVALSLESSLSLSATIAMHRMLSATAFNLSIVPDGYIGSLLRSVLDVKNALRIGGTLDVATTLLSRLSDEVDIRFSIIERFSGYIDVVNSLSSLYMSSGTLTVLNTLRGDDLFLPNRVFYLQTHGLS